MTTVDTARSSATLTPEKLQFYRLGVGNQTVRAIVGRKFCANGEGVLP